MKKQILGIMLSLLMAFSAIPAGAFAQESDPADYGTPGVDYAEGEAIVYVDGGAAALNNTNGRSRSAAAYETEELMTVEPSAEPAAENSPMLRSAAPASGKSLVLVKSGQDTESLIADLQNNPNVAFAEPNYYVQAYDVNEPKDPGYKDQWALRNQLNNNDPNAPNPAVDINAVKAWEQTDTSKTPVVAVLDSGVDYNNPDLQNIMWKDGENYPALTAMGGGQYGYNAITTEDSEDPMDTDIGHGTHCAGIIAAQWDNNIGGASVNSNAQIMAVRFLSLTGGDIAGAIRGYAYIQAAATEGVNVVAVNNSWGPSNYDGRQLRSVSTAATAIGKDFGVVSCFAAGNSNTNNDLNSGGNVDSPYAVIVGAMDSEGYKSFFSCYGQETVDVFAPGSQILSTTSTDKELAMNEHEMPVQYLPQIQETGDSYFYEDFESTSKVGLRLLDGDGKVVETARSAALSPGYASANGLQLSLDSIKDGDSFAIEMVFNRTDLTNIDKTKAFHIAFQGGCDNAMYGQSFLLQYQDKDGEWQAFNSTQVLTKDSEGNPTSYLPARLRLSDHNWNQSTQEVNLPDFAEYINEDAKEEVVLRLVPKPAEEGQPGVMSGKIGDSATFRLDDVGFGKQASDYFYSDGTSMATPVVTGIAALLSTKFGADQRNAERASEICARIKGGVNRTDAQADLENASISNGFVDAGAAFDDAQCVPVLNDLKIEGGQATLTGYFFGDKGGTVSIGGQNAATTQWADKSITFTLPADVKGKQEVKVTPKGKDYGRNFFSITLDTVNYQVLEAPNLDYGQLSGYPLTSADLYPLAAAATDNTFIYSGITLETSQGKLASYDFEKKVWSDVPLPENTLVNLIAAGKTKFYMHCVTVNTDDSQNVSTKQVLAVYDPAAKKWSQVETELPTGAALVVYQDKLLAIGGDDSDGNATKSVQIINPETGKAAGTLTDLPEGRSAASVSASGNTLVVQGGNNGTTKTGDDAITYTNTMTFDGKDWTPHKDNFLTKDNPDFDKNQTLNYALTAVNNGMLAVGPVHNLDKADMMDTWSFNSKDGTWAGMADRLYSQIKTTQNIGAAAGGQFYVLGYTGKSEEPLVFRSTTVDYTGPTGDPSGDKPTPPEPSPTVQPTINPTPTTTTDTTGNNAGTGIFGGPSGMALTAVVVLLLAAGGLVVYRKRKG